eukprot:TRINITY_DN1880_c0_g1_i2.p1 TRINITY_DN1880_c0_g1~~TRINITY_DN1880_c0_g1_i2.p1  ORF type:complete len:255 (-),score=50.54 TRINITY_DN1880_c0_g1_i2:1-744(-)
MMRGAIVVIVVFMSLYLTYVDSSSSSLCASSSNTNMWLIGAFGNPQVQQYAALSIEDLLFSPFYVNRTNTVCDSNATYRSPYVHVSPTKSENGQVDEIVATTACFIRDISTLNSIINSTVKFSTGATSKLNQSDDDDGCWCEIETPPSGQYITGYHLTLYSKLSTLGGIKIGLDLYGCSVSTTTSNEPLKEGDVFWQNISTSVDENGYPFPVISLQLTEALVAVFVVCVVALFSCIGTSIWACCKLC